MKKLLIFILFIFMIIMIYVFISNYPKSYDVTYSVDNAKVVEKYNVSKEYYYFNIEIDDYKFDYVFNMSYSKKRKIVDKVKVINNDEYFCINVIIDNKVSPQICSDGKNYFTNDVINSSKNTSEIIDEYEGIEIYNNNMEYILWNGYGLTDIFNDKDYKIFEKESYDNYLAYKFKNYIIFADYDAKREFNKFYIYDNSTKKIEKWNIDYNISQASYFMGDYDNYIFLFDKKNKIQYKLDIEKKDISISSDENGAVFYDNGWTNQTLNKLSYNELMFNVDSLYQYTLKNNNLYYNYIDSDILIKITNLDVKDIIDFDENHVYYLSEDILYAYDIMSGESKLLKYFEWNFSYKNKIYIFN